MGKTLRIALYTLISFVLVVFVLGTVSLVKKGGRNISTNLESNIGNIIADYRNDSASIADGSVIEEKNAENIYEELNIKWNGEDIFITESSDIDEIEIYVLSGEHKKNIYSTNYITQKNKIVKISNNNLTENLEILLPDNYFKNEITINAPCANVYLLGVTTKNIQVNTDFGNVLAKDVNANSLYIGSESGIIYTSGGKYVIMEIESDTGKVSANSNADEFYLSSNEGNIDFEPITDWVRADITSNSGDITLSLSPEYGYTIEVSPTDTQISFDNKLKYEFTNNKYVFNDGAAYINIKEITGNIYAVESEQ